MICKKAKCRNAWYSGLGFGRYRANSATTTRTSLNPEIMQEVPVNGPVLSVTKPVELSPYDRCAGCGREDDLVDRQIADGRVTVCRDCDHPPFPKVEQLLGGPAASPPKTPAKPAADHWSGTWDVLSVIPGGEPITANNYHCAIVDAGHALAEAERVNGAHWKAAEAGKYRYRSPRAPDFERGGVSSHAGTKSPQLTTLSAVGDCLDIPAFLRRAPPQLDTGFKLAA
jgi:hypothetical protein